MTKLVSRPFEVYDVSVLKSHLEYGLGKLIVSVRQNRILFPVIRTIRGQICLYFYFKVICTKTTNPAVKIAEKAVRRSVFLTKWHCILNADSTKTHSSSVTLQRFCRLGNRNLLVLKNYSSIFEIKVVVLSMMYRMSQKNVPAIFLYVNDNLIYAHLHRLPQIANPTWGKRCKFIMYS